MDKVTKIRLFLSDASQAVRGAVGAVAGRNVADGLWEGGEAMEDGVRLLALADAKTALEYVLSGELEDALGKQPLSPSSSSSSSTSTFAGAPGAGGAAAVGAAAGAARVVDAIVLKVTGKPARSLPPESAPAPAPTPAQIHALQKPSSVPASMSTPSLPPKPLKPSRASSQLPPPAAAAATTGSSSAATAPVPKPMPPAVPMPPPPSLKVNAPVVYCNPWLIDRLTALNFDRKVVLHCHEVLVCTEGYVSEEGLAEESEAEFHAEYLKGVGISGKGVLNTLVKLHRELRAQHFPGSLAGSPVPPSEHSPVSSPLLSQEEVLQKFSTVEALQTQLQKVVQEQQKQQEQLQSYEKGSKGAKGTEGGGGGGGSGGGSSGGLQQMQKQKQDSQAKKEEEEEGSSESTYTVLQLQQRQEVLERYIAQLQAALAEVAAVTEGRLEHLEGAGNSVGRNVK
jgi:hypothetical protein